MKKLTKSIVAVASIGLVTAGGLAFAGDMKGDHKARMLEKFDTNKNGQLDPSEQEAMKAFRQEKRAEFEQELLGKYDANKNGVLDDDERAKAHAEKSAELFKKLDTDGNGQLSLQEFQQLKPGMGGDHGRHGKKR